MATSTNQSSDVSLISNPIPSFAVFQWLPRGLKNLTRRNKLSSLPFWFPNDVARKHQFRLALLRGVVKQETEAEDCVAVYLEYIPPPSDTHPTAGHPKGCRVTMRLVNRHFMNEGDRSHDITEEQTVSIDDEERQVGFREFITPQALENAAFASEEGNSVILEVSILSGVSVVAVNVAKSTEQIAGSLWGAFTSLSSSVSTLVKKTVAVVQEQRDEFEHAFGGSSAAQQQTSASSSSAVTRELPWDDVPEKWRNGREAAWRHFITKVLVEDENTFLIGARRGLSSDEQLLLTQYAVNHRSVMAADGTFDYDRDVHEGLLSLPELRAQRYRLVPLKVKDEMFWANFMWKVYSLATCSTDEQAQLLLSIINAPPLPQGRQDAASTSASSLARDGAASVSSTLQSVFQFTVGGLSSLSLGGASKPLTEAEVAQAIHAAMEASSALEEMLGEAENPPICEDESDQFLVTAVSACESNAAQLQRLIARGGDEMLIESLQAAAVSVAKQLDAHKSRKALGETNVVSDAKCTVDTAAAAREPDASSCSKPDDHSHVDVSRQADPQPLVCPTEPKGDAGNGANILSDETMVSASPSAEQKAAEEDKPSAAASTRGDSFERLPSIDDIETPVGAQRQGSVTVSSSAKKLDFVPMPWEEDENV